jgi:hypothetical protein
VQFPSLARRTQPDGRLLVIHQAQLEAPTHWLHVLYPQDGQTAGFLVHDLHCGIWELAIHELDERHHAQDNEEVQDLIK